MRDAVRTVKAMLQKGGQKLTEWVDLVSAVVWTVNTVFRERYACIPYHVMFGCAPNTGISRLASSSGGE